MSENVLGKLFSINMISENNAGINLYIHKILASWSEVHFHTFFNGDHLRINIRQFRIKTRWGITSVYFGLTYHFPDLHHIHENQTSANNYELFSQSSFLNGLSLHWKI